MLLLARWTALASRLVLPLKQAALTVKWSGWIILRVGAMLHYGFHRESAGDFTMRFAAHAIGKHKKV